MNSPVPVTFLVRTGIAVPSANGVNLYFAPHGGLVSGAAFAQVPYSRVAADAIAGITAKAATASTAVRLVKRNFLCIPIAPLVFDPWFASELPPRQWRTVLPDDSTLIAGWPHGNGARGAQRRRRDALRGHKQHPIERLRRLPRGSCG